jgi:lipid A ethanolaminephosphotransferase
VKSDSGHVVRSHRTASRRIVSDRLRWDPSPARFILAAALVNTAIYQRPLYEFATHHLDGTWFSQALTLGTVFFLVTFVTCAILGAVATVSPRLLRPFCMVVVAGNAIALYFVDHYGIILDKAMMGDVFGTDRNEASSFLHPAIAMHLLLLGVPLALLLRTRIEPVKIGSRLRFLAAVLVVGLAGGCLNAAQWPWINHYSRQLGGLTMPWSYLINSGRYGAAQLRGPRTVALLPSATFADDRKTIVVLVIGESARAANFSLYGYSRFTNPQLSNAGVVVLDHTTACATYTSAAVRCLLSPSGSPTRADEPLPTYLHRQGVDVTWRTNNGGEPPLAVTTFEPAADLRKSCEGDDCGFDDILLHGLEQRLRTSTNPRIFVVLHQHGSHGPDYVKRYPPRFDVFRPVCASVDLQRCATPELVNAYDNTILYTDDFLARTIALLRRLDDTRSVMLYLSDHGESLGENGLYLHGATPLADAPDVQKDIPFLVWMSDSFQQSRGITAERLLARSVHSQAEIFHSVMGAFDMRSAVHDEARDLFSDPAQRPRPGS